MTRPSSNLDKKMLKAGRKIVATEGSSGLTIPKICALAKANLGMFNYHFKTRDNYIEILYAGFLREILEYINFESVAKENSLVRLKYFLLKFAEFTKKEPQLMKFIIIDGLNCNKKIYDFIERGVIPKYYRLINLIKEAQMDGYLNKDIPISEIYAAFVLGFLGPEIFKKAFIDREEMHDIKSPSIKDYPLEKRLDVVLKGYLA